jgi:hypothetical protein
MRAHINPITNEILGYYPEEINYPNLPPENELQTITDEEHQQALEINANVWSTDGPKVDESLYPADDPIPELTPEEKLNALGLNKNELKKLLGVK